MKKKNKEIKWYTASNFLLKEVFQCFVDENKVKKNACKIYTKMLRKIWPKIRLLILKFLLKIFSTL